MTAFAGKPTMLKYYRRDFAKASMPGSCAAPHLFQGDTMFHDQQANCGGVGDGQ